MKSLIIIFINQIQSKRNAFFNKVISYKLYTRSLQISYI